MPSAIPPFFLDQQTFHGPSDRFQKNLQALEVLARLACEQRPATADEQLVLAHFTSFGESALLTRLVNATDDTLPAVLTEPAVDALRRAALTAYYTPLSIVQAIWAALMRLGFGQLPSFRMLEPAAGVGNFISAMPPELRAKAQITAVELEPLSARILGQLHPDITLWGGMGFQDAPLPENAFDLAISNVPFGDFGVADVTIKERFLVARIHDYFFARAIRLVRPGGIVAFLTSYGTLDKQDRRMRQWLAARAELLAAYRLPSGIFADNGGSQAGTDLIMLRKYHIDELPQAADWLDLAAVTLPAWTGSFHATTGARYGNEPDTLTIAGYFAHHPEQVIGTAYEIRRSGYLYYVVAPPGDTDLATALQQRLAATLPADLVTEAPPPVLVTSSLPARDLLADMVAVPDLDAVALPQRARAAALGEVYRAAKALMHLELQDADTTTLETARRALNSAYDTFVQIYGIIASPANRRLFKHLPELAFLQALEERPACAHGMWVAEKAPIFSRRTLRPLPRDDTGAMTVQDALIRSLDTTGQVDLPLIGRLSGQPKELVLQELHGVIFRVPDLAMEAYQTADAYLSGNVRIKLRDARTLATIDTTFQYNVDALEQVQPPPLGKDDIIVRLGAAWVPVEVVQAFIGQLLPAFRGSVRFHAFDASWSISADYAATVSVENLARWGTQRLSALEIIQALLIHAPIIVRDVIELPDGGTSSVVNDKETAAAQEKAEAIRTAFADWIWADTEREHQLIAIYNERFNALRPRDYDGAHLSLPGLNTAVLRGGDLAPWQKAAVWQALQCPATLLAHAVGAGKTFTMVTIAREARRMGLANKPLMVVPNHLVGQTASEALRLFPGLKVLSLGSEDFEKRRRGVVLSRIATGDWDLVIVPCTSFQFLPVDPAVLETFYARERARLRDALEAAEADSKKPGMDLRDGKRAIKKIEKALERLEVRIKDAIGRIKRDSTRVITWRELGIDLLMVDEAHTYKNLYVPTRLTVAGAPQADSLRAMDLRIKSWDLLRRGCKVIFATATPIMNTLGEAFVMQRYLQEQELAAMGIDHFDAWVSVFAEVRDMFEMKPDGSGFQVKSRLNTFINLPELAQLWRTVLNVRTAEQLALPRPTLVTGKPIVVSVPASRALRRLTQQLVARVDRIKNRQVDPTADNMLKVTSEARLAALDTRLLIGGPEAPRCKINAVVERVAALYHSYSDAQATQLIFCDLATPKGKREAPPAEGANATAADEPPAQDVETAAEQSLNNRVYHEIREKLARHGIPDAAVAFIHDYPTRARRDELFAAMNAGQIRVLIGSTNKMGTGMNVQRRLIALHHLDAPWRPGDVEQRDGRILRQGNLWPQCYIFHYVTEHSFDGFLWQLLENKARFIGQVITGEVTARMADDVGDTVLTAAEVKAIASGNPRIRERFTIENELARLDRVYRAWADARRTLERKQRWAEVAVVDRQQRIAKLTVAQRIYQAHAAADFVVALEKHVGDATQVTYTRRAAAGQALLTLLTQYRTAALFQKQTIVRAIGTYRGMTLRVQAPRLELNPVTLVLAAEDAGDVFERVFDEITAQGVIASIDAGLREIAERIVRQQREMSTDEGLIAACAAELERTAIWDGEARWQQLSVELATITAELSKAEAEPTAPAEPPEVSTAEATDIVQAEAQAEAQAIEDDPAWQIESVPLEQRIPPATASLALLSTLSQAPRRVETSVSPDERPETAVLEAMVDTPTTASTAPATPAKQRPRFGDRVLIERVRRTPKTSAPSLPVHDAPEQLDLFVTLTIPVLSARAPELIPTTVQQLTLL
jgi:N12 class adenine-specific DNA methylase